MSDEENKSPKELREYADRVKAENEALKQERAELEAAKRELAFHKAGVDLDSPAGKLLYKAYDGELDSEKIQSEWAPLAPAKAAAVDDEPDDGPTEQEQAHAAAARSLRSDGVPPGEEPTENPIDVSSFQKAREKGTRVTEAQRQYVQRVFNAAVDGDPRAIYDPDRDRGQG